jgi:hypothetical protein
MSKARDFDTWAAVNEQKVRHKTMKFDTIAELDPSGQNFRFRPTTAVPVLPVVLSKTLTEAKERVNKTYDTLVDLVRGQMKQIS